ncbi:MAG: KH domain-containing protein [Lachnospira sp.]|nr:KH domain-containing protein [Lachnospira sp.]MDD5829019.1 KH domain-containing protein [Lachnospira sp.]
MENQYIEVTGKTLDDAITNACQELGTHSANIEYEVIDKGNSGFLGLFNSKPAKIKARVKSESSSEKLEKELIKKTTETKKAPVKKEENTKKAEPKKTEVKKAEPVEAKSEEKASDNKAATAMSNEEIESKIKDFLNDMFKAMDMDVTVTVTFNEEDECVNVDLSGENMGVLIGKRGQTLDSIQYLTSLVLNKGKNKYVRIKVDTENYRTRRKETLENLAKNIAYKVKRSKRSVALEPMNPYERRIIHSALQSDKYVSTKSEGEEPFRHVVVFLDREKNPNYNSRYNRNN